jgi:ribonuclease HI
VTPQQLLEAIAGLPEADRQALFARLREVYGETLRGPAPRATARSDWDGQVDYLVVFDGGSRGNPGAGYGSYAIFDASGAGFTIRLTFEDGPLTNNEAEYQTLLAALRDLGQRLGRRAPAATLKITGDSQLVIRQLSGEWDARDGRMRALRDEARAALAQFQGYRLSQQPREDIVRILGH